MGVSATLVTLTLWVEICDMKVGMADASAIELLTTTKPAATIHATETAMRARSDDSRRAMNDPPESILRDDPSSIRWKLDPRQGCVRVKGTIRSGAGSGEC
ncbi:MAG TPA: hypothetical protein VGL39_17625 [Jatrophihabitantaceae bacterium]